VRIHNHKMDKKAVFQFEIHVQSMIHMPESMNFKAHSSTSLCLLLAVNRPSGLDAVTQAVCGAASTSACPA